MERESKITSFLHQHKILTCVVIAVCPVPKTLSRTEDFGDQSFAVLFSWPYQEILFTEIDEIRQLDGSLKFILTSATSQTWSWCFWKPLTAALLTLTVKHFLCCITADEEYEKLRERRRNCQPSQMYGQLTINLSSLTIVPMLAILIVLYMIISGSRTQSAAYRSHHSPTGDVVCWRVC